MLGVARHAPQLAVVALVVLELLHLIAQPVAFQLGGVATLLERRHLARRSRALADALERLRRDAEMPNGVSSVTVEEYYWDDGNKTPRPSTRIFAVAPDGEKLGICETISSNEYDDAPQLADTCFVSWLGVPPVRENLNSNGYDDRSSPVQGKGLGVRLHTCARAL